MWALETFLLEVVLLLLCVIPSFAPSLFLSSHFYITHLSLLGSVPWFSRDLYSTATCPWNYTTLEKEKWWAFFRVNSLNFDFLSLRYLWVIDGCLLGMNLAICSHTLPVLVLTINNRYHGAFSKIFLPLSCLCQTHDQDLLFFSLFFTLNIKYVLLQHRDWKDCNFL